MSERQKYEKKLDELIERTEKIETSLDKMKTILELIEGRLKLSSKP